MLGLTDIAKSFPGPAGPVRVLAGLSLQLAPGGFVAVQGSSGCGKTTLLLIAAGLLHPDQGRVRIGGSEVYALSSEARARLRATRVGMVFQQYHLIPYLSVLDNVLCPSLALPNAQAAPRAGALLERLGLAHRSRHRPGQLSLGERQRTALARALLNLPSLLLVDEPTGNLDPHNAAAILDCLAEFAQAGGAVLMVTHDPAAARRADRVLRLADGAIANAPAEAAS